MKSKRVIVMVLVLVFAVLAMSACEKKPGGEPDPPEVPAPDGTAEEGWTWPLPEQKELSVWLTWSNEYVNSPNELLGIQAIEKATNVKVNWHTVADTEASEKFGLMIASGDIPDIIRGANNYYTGGLSKMVEDGVSIDLTDYVPKYMPNYLSLLSQSEQLQKDSVTDDGKRAAVYTITSDFGKVEGERAWGGLCIRRDWLEDLGLESPVTIDDWYTVLSAFREVEGCDAPLLIGANGTDVYGSWVSAYGVGPDFYQDNGVVKYGPAEPGYHEFLKTFHKWYEEGLIDRNFASNDASLMASGDYLGTGRSGASANIVGLTADVWKTMGYTDDPDFFLSAVPYPVLNEGDTSYVLYNMRDLMKEALVITAGCEDAQLACRYLDYWYTKEAMLYDSLGIEGDSYTVDAQGNYALTDSFMEQVPTYQSELGTLAARYTLVTSHFGLYNWAGLDISSPQSTKDQSLIWSEASGTMSLPTYMTMTDTESVEFASLYTAVQTLTQEYTVKAITGNADLEGDYEEFLNKLGSYGADRCVAIKQAALDRYNAR